MIHTYKLNGETWIDIDHGTPREIHNVMQMYNIHPFVAKELEASTPKPRIEFHEGYIYFILHFPVWKHSHKKGEKTQEVDFVVGQDVTITARYDTIDTLHKLGKDLEVSEILEKTEEIEARHTYIIFTNILRALYASVFEELEYAEDIVEDITGKIFKGEERQMVVSISEITRTLLDFKRVTDMHYEILETLKHRGQEIFGNEFANEMESIILDYSKINTTIKSNLEMLRELRETDDSLLTAKQNEKIKQLTLVGAILFIISILLSIFLR